MAIPRNLGRSVLSLALSMAGVGWLYGVVWQRPYGWGFGIGLVLLIFVHEMGHIVECLRQGIPVSGPVFMGPLGAFVHHQHVTAAGRQAAISIAGPLAGLAGAALCAAAAAVLPAGGARLLLLDLARAGCLLTLINLLPIGPLDGARIWGGVSRATIAVATALAAAAAATLLAARGVHPVALLAVVVAGAYVLLRPARYQPPWPRGQVMLDLCAAVTVLASCAGTLLSDPAGLGTRGRLQDSAAAQLRYPGSEQLSMQDSGPACVLAAGGVRVSSETYEAVYAVSDGGDTVRRWYAARLGELGWTAVDNGFAPPGVPAPGAPQFLDIAEEPGHAGATAILVTIAAKSGPCSG